MSDRHGGPTVNDGRQEGARDGCSFESLEELLQWARAAPPSTQLRVALLVPLLEKRTAEGGGELQAAESKLDSIELTWREKLWLVPAQTRLGVTELAEALDRSADWIYHRTQAAADDPLPHAKLDGSLVFRVGEIRTWLEEHEVVEHAESMRSVPAERRLQLLEE